MSPKRRLSFTSRPPISLEEELERFAELQHDLMDRWLRVSDIDSGPRDIVVVPSLSIEGLPMSSIPGITHYEERMLFTMMLLRHPRAHLVYVTSQPMHPAMVDYLVAMVRGIPAAHVRERLSLLSTYDSSPRPLTDKILERPRLIARICDHISPERAHLLCFTVSELERRLAVRLGIPLYGVDPKLLPHGTKSGSRRVFREAGVSMPPGVEDVRDERAVAEAVADLWEEDPKLARVVVKHDHGFSGEGNAVLSLSTMGEAAPKACKRSERVERVLERLPEMRFASDSETWDAFRTKLEGMGGIVEAFVEGSSKRSPSAQLRINPRRELQPMSTHDQLLDGEDDQTYGGCVFPADEGYRMAIQEDGLKVGEVLKREGVVGRFAVDFIAVERPGEPGEWDHYAIEINLRITGTTHPMMLMKMLNDGEYDPASGLYVTKRGDSRMYVSSDSLASPHYRGLLVDDLLDIAAVHGLHYQPWTDSGVVFHMTGALSQFGKLGITTIGETVDEAQRWFDATRETLDVETAPSVAGDGEEG